MKLSVILVSYNVKHYLEQAVRSVLLSAGTDIATEIFIVDNASTDGSAEYLSARFPATHHADVHIIANRENAGFGRANNQALARATGEYVLFLNPDTLLTENTLRDCLAFADARPDLGALGVEMLKADGTFAFESRRGLPTPWTAFCKMSGLAALRPRSKRFGKYYMRYLDATRPARIEIVSGAFFMARREALNACSGFDEDFFMYGEDIDLSYRLLKRGLHNYYLPTPILHYKGESTQKSSYRYVHVFYNAMLIFYRKHYHHSHFSLTLLVKAAILGRALLALAANGSRRLLRPFRLHRLTVRPRYLFLGSENHFAAIRNLADRHGLDITCRNAFGGTTTDNAPSRDDNTYRYVIYDTTVFTPGRILDLIKHSDHRSTVCTYYPADSLLITKDDIFTLTPHETAETPYTPQP